ncbi:hypothetical protein BJ138DRAFT_1140022 [Hygrophoropsis aurantiaca]|uniref:Uncharacterized protein n=1 Tax=Hygrophoropsis aurantiaca TaxID=72124 RepID=A0ACB8ATF3_9AGAM|nr:hypothetical protein BJ138DRAFT_1140022 [Hygrophoropsis aurantiaca]
MFYKLFNIFVAAPESTPARCHSASNDQVTIHPMMLFGLRVTCLLVAIAARTIARPCTDEPPPPLMFPCTETLPYSKGANWAFKGWRDTVCLGQYSGSHDYFSSYLADQPAHSTNHLAANHSSCQRLSNTAKGLGSFILQAKTPKWVRFYYDANCKNAVLFADSGVGHYHFGQSDVPSRFFSLKAAGSFEIFNKELPVIWPMGLQSQS